MKVLLALSLAAASCLLFQISTLAYADSCTSVKPEPGIRLDIAHLDLRGAQIAARLYAQIQESASMLCRDSAAPWDGRGWRRGSAASPQPSKARCDRPTRPS